MPRSLRLPMMSLFRSSNKSRLRFPRNVLLQVLPVWKRTIPLHSQQSRMV